MRKRLCSRVACALAGVVLCTVAYGDVVLEEHSGYVEGENYDVTWSEDDVPSILIREPSTSELGPYDFDCYDDGTNAPATIGWITALRNIGDVEIMVREHEDRWYGAWDVRLLQLNQDGVNSSVKEFNIAFDLGADGEVVVDEIAGDFFARDIVNDAYIETLASGCFSPESLSTNLYITGQGPHAGSIDIDYFDDASKIISITGTIEGSISLGSG